MKKLVLVIGFLLVLCMATNVSAINDDNLQSKVNELERRVEALEGNQSVHETRISALESLVDFIHARLESVKEWLFFWTYEQGDVCDAVESGCVQPQINCSSDAECGTDAGDLYCSDGDVYQDFTEGLCVNPGTEESHCNYIDTSFTPTMIEDCEYGCDNGACTSPPTAGKVIFRTNVVQGDGENYNRGITNDGSGAWIALDADEDGNLEGYGKTNGAILSGCDVPEEEIGRTPDGFKLIKDDKGDIGVCYRGDTGSARRYSTADSDAENAVLSPLPTEPYASNGQELYEDGFGGSGGGGGNGGDGDGTGINVTIDIDSGTNS